MRVTCRARAKINLTLRITGRRGDGYHLLDSVVVFADVADDLVFEPAAALSLEIEGRFAPALTNAPDNLVLRAAERLAAAAGTRAGTRISLRKNLPVAAGIGGGSSDAAQTFVALNRLWDLGLPAAELADLALPLGADLPVCLAAAPSRVTGIGGTIAPIGGLPPAWLLLVNPGVSLATGSVFAARRGDFSLADPDPAEKTQDVGDLARWLAASANDLEAPARRLCPEVGQTLAALSNSDGCLLARMSGSGATCFGIFARHGEAAAAAARIGAAHADWWCAPAPLLTRAGDPPPESGS